MKPLKKLASCLFAIMLGASLMAAPATMAFADEASNAAADSISQTPPVTTENLSGEADAANTVSDAAAATESTDAPAITTNESSLQAISSGQHVISEDGLVPSSDFDRLNSMAKSIENSFQVDAYYITVSSLQGSDSAATFAEEYINAYGLDKRNANGCVVFLVCLNEGKYSLVSIGNVANTLSDDMLDFMDKDLFPYLGRSDWSGAAETFFGDVETTLKGGKPNSTSDVKYNGTFVTDAYGLFSDSQRATLEAKATELAEKYNMGVYLLIVDKMNGLDNPTQAQRTNFATSFYRANNLGLGSGRDGIMFVIAVDSRDYVTIAFGQGSYSFSDEGVAYMEDAVREELGSNQWYDGCEVYYDKIGEQLEYYSVKGEPWTEPNPLSFILKILAILGIPAGVAFSSVRRQEDAMFTAREKTEASNYLVRGSLELTQSTDQFSHTTHVVTPIPQHEDHDSGGGSSFGGGGWGGGGGGGFSSSGGGKF